MKEPFGGFADENHLMNWSCLSPAASYCNWKHLDETEIEIAERAIVNNIVS